MKNVDVKYDAKKKTLTLTIDCSKEFGLSKSQKNIIIASTEGNAAVDGSEGVKIGLNVYRPKAE